MFSDKAEELTVAPDVYLWMNVFLVLSTKAKEKAILSPMLDIFGEFLPFVCNGSKYYIFTVYSIIEPELSKFSFLSFNPVIIGTHIIFNNQL
jgi:hypothetical protein